VCANYIGKEKIFKQYIVKKIKGQRILIIGVTDKEHTNFKLSKDFNDSDFIDPKKAVKNILKLHKKSGDLVIVLGFLSEKKIKEIIDYNPRVNLVLHGKNEILLKKPYIYGKTLIAQSYFNSKKIGKISLKFVRNRIVNWNFKYDRLSPSVGELADIFNRTYKLLGDTEARKRYNVYLIFDKFLPNKNEKEIIKFLKKNNIQYKALFENLDSKNVNEVELINEHSDKFVSSQYYPQEETTEKIIYKNQREITNFGKNDLKPCIFTGLRYFYLDDLTIKDIRWDLQILGLIK
jgi:2',3'-cyclic-nucleotide 2'-phosphodiesterase (5'-nucleotidase family)